MRLLILGANGLLGSNVVTAAVTRGWDAVGAYHSESPGFDVPLYQFDIRNGARVRQLVDRCKPDIVVNCAAMTDVDACERNPETARAVNADAPRDVANVCVARDIRFVHISTDYVFDGTADSPYTESAETAPRQEYGASKLAGERAVRAVLDSVLILRLSFVYGIHRVTESLVGFPAWVRDNLREGESVPLFTDQHVSPTRAGHASGVLLSLLSEEVTDTYHVTCRSCVTPYSFGRAIGNRMNVADYSIEEASLLDVSRPAMRPRYTCLDVSAVETVLGRSQPTLGDDLDAIIDRL